MNAPVVESRRSKVARYAANLAPPYRGTGARITAISADLREVHVRLAATWRTRNHLGMIWGGALYGAIDPIYGVMLGVLLGPDYWVVDRAAHVEFLRPARSAVTARFVIDHAELSQIYTLIHERGRLDRRYEVELRDDDGQICVRCEKTVHVRYGPRADGSPWLGSLLAWALGSASDPRRDV